MKFHEIEISEKEEKYVLEALRSGSTVGRGKYTQAVEFELKRKLACTHVYMTTSGTHALEMATHLSGLSEGDEVLVPSYTFPSTANAVLLTGAKPVLVPVDEETLCLSSDIIEQHVTSNTRAVMVVHYAGICHDMDRIVEICRRKKLILIEDAAQAFGSLYKGKPLGTYGDFGCFSFHGTKNDVAGEGGALIISEAHISEGNKDTVRLAERFLEKGTDRMAFLRGEQATYEWRGAGSSYVPSDILMALLKAQLESHDKRFDRRREIVGKYVEAFMPFCSENLRIFRGFRGEYALEEERNEPIGISNGHIFYICFKTPGMGLRFKEKMDVYEIPVRQHFVPLHVSKMGSDLGYAPDVFTNELDLFERLYRLPLHTKLTESETAYIINGAKASIEYAMEGSL